MKYSIPISLLFSSLVLTACSDSTTEQLAQSQQPDAMSSQPDAAVLQQLAVLNQSVEYAEDLSAIKRLQKSYGYYLDKGLWTDLAEFFADDARANYPAGVYVGKDSIREHLYRNVGGVQMGEVGLGDGRLYNHMNIQPVVHLDEGGTTASGRWRAIAMFGRYGVGSGTWAEGVYNLNYVEENGVWKIAGLEYYDGYGASYADGWGANPDAEPRGPRTYAHPADEARTINCGFPIACIAPFHYDNLGTSDDSNAWHAPATVASLPAGTDYGQLAADLKQRAQVLRDETLIENLQRIYGYYIDRNMWDEAAALFADDGSIELAQQGIYQGPQRIAEFLHTLGPDGVRDGWLNDHVQVQTIVTVAPDGMSARARTREWNMIGEYGNSGSGRWSEGLFENSYIKEDGAWKIADMHYYPTFITDYDQGWGQSALPAPGINAELPPDAPPSDVYAIYPQAHVPAFHYMNPVTGEQTTYPADGGPSQQALATNEFKPAAYTPPPATDLNAAISEAQALLQQVKDHHEIENLENAYGYYLDKNLWNDLSDLFANEGSMELAQRGVYIGRERVRDFLFNVFGNEGPVEGRLGNHIHFQPVITLNSDTSANVRSRMMQQLSFGGGPSMGAAVYENEIIKENGKWKFLSTHAFNTWTARYEGGWVENPGNRVPGPSENFPPDAPPSFEFAMFPTVYDFPFHYLPTLTTMPAR